MIKNKLLTGCLLALASAHAFSASQTGFYMSAKAGAGLLKTTDNSLRGSGMTAGALSYNIEKENLKNITDTVFSPGIAVGYQFTGDTYQPVRVELAYQHYGKQDDTMSFSPSVSGYWHNQKNNIFPLPSESSLYMKTKADTLMVNVYYDIPVNNNISAYLMAGAGAAFIRNDVSWDTNVAGQALSAGASKNVTNLAWSAGAGISWNINENISLDTGYTYTDAGSAENRIVARNGINTATGYTNTDVKLHLLYAGIRYHF